ncbi:phage virion morphogenesis protein [Leptospira weilii]|uniref:phage virion morphogenesis protein n=1 Tax=Leptospira weilii TaxID=28184 RepID=UPI00201B8E42|nr:phage virion morphogenesis protein [Leptospira weilii]UPY80431.1 phage virion morphogenesis protein [Leptospira weilii]
MSKSSFLSVTDSFGPMLQGAISKGQDKLTQVQDKNAAVVQANIIKGIRSQKYKSGWPELAETTKEKKQKEGRSPLTLIEEGDFPLRLKLKENDSRVVGTNSPCTRIHEFGFETKIIPARPYFRPALEDSKELIIENFKDALKEIFKK